MQLKLLITIVLKVLMIAILWDWGFQHTQRTKNGSYEHPSEYKHCNYEDDPDEVFLEPHVPLEFVCSAFE